MIRTLTIRGFSCHANLTIALGPGVNTLVGRNGAGKTAALRALRWLFTNKPSGQSFLGNWREADFAFVKAELDGGKWVARKRGTGINWFKLNGRLLKAFGTSPPDPVADLVNVGSVNFQFQHDGPYWFNLSPAQVSKNLNDIINLSSIDRCLALAATNVRQSKAEVKVCRDRLDKAKQAKAETEWIDSAIVDMNRLTGIQDSIAAIAPELHQMRSTAEAIAEASYTRSVASETILALRRALRTGEKRRQLAERLETMELTAVAIQNAQRIAQTPIPDLNRLTAARDRAKAVEARLRKAQSYIYGLQIVQEEFGQCQKQLREVQRRIAKLAGKNCPACGRPIRLP